MIFDLFNLGMFVVLGSIAGFLGGLIGIGGGLVLVPGLYYVFVHAGIAPGQEMWLTLGTAMAGMLFTAASSVVTHLNYNIIRLDVVRRLAAWVAIGTVVGAILATRLDPGLVKIGFAAFCVYSATRMLFFSKARVGTGANPIESAKLQAPGMFFGLVCGLMGIGGANLFVPYLMARSLDIRHAMATASALQIPIAIIGTISYMGLGMSKNTPAWAVGYVYLPALLVVASTSILAARIGVRVSHKLPISALKKLFGIVAAIGGLKMAGAFSFFL